MRQKRDAGPDSSEQTIRNIRRATRRRFSAEEKIRVVLDDLRVDDSIVEGTARGLIHRNRSAVKTTD